MVDQLVDPTSCVVLVYVKRRRKVEESAVFVDSSRCSCVGDSEKETGFVDLDGNLFSGRASSDGDFTSFEGG